MHLEHSIASRKQSDFIHLAPYYNISFACMTPRKQLRYFYIRDFKAIKKEEHLDILDIDTDCNYDLINPVYQLYIMLAHNSFGILDLVNNIEENKWYKSYFKDIKTLNEIEDLYDLIFRSDDFFNRFEKDIDINTSISSFLHGKMWNELRGRCKKFLKKSGMPVWRSFEKPIQFDIFLYPINLEAYQALPYWSYYKTFDRETWNELKRKYDLLYKNAILNFNN